MSGRVYATHEYSCAPMEPIIQLLNQRSQYSKYMRARPGRMGMGILEPVSMFMCMSMAPYHMIMGMDILEPVDAFSLHPSVIQTDASAKVS